jgi:hypothetical protein
MIEGLLRKMQVILVSGKAGTGKTTTANILKKLFVEDNRNAIVTPFAYGLKLVCKNLGWDGVKDAKGRQFLIDIGRSGRTYDKDTWVKLSWSLVQDSPFPLVAYIVDDWRYPNEREFFIKNPQIDVTTIRVEAPDREILKGSPLYNDDTETSLPTSNEFWTNFTSIENTLYNYIIDNSKDMESLEKTCQIIYNVLIRKALVK